MHPAKPKDINEYIANFPKATQALLEQMRLTIKEAAPDAEETINYGMPTFTLKGNLVHFAGYQNHIGFYPAPSGIQAFQQELSVYKNAKGSVQFPLNQVLPLNLVAEIVKFRVIENLEKAATKGKKKASPKPEKLTDSEQVTAHIQNLEPELGKIIETLRQIILNTHHEIGERIKWNNPSFYYAGEMKPFDPKEYKRDMIVMNLFKGRIMLVFPSGAKVNDTLGLLDGDYKDGRRIITFKDMIDVNSKEKALQHIIQEWLTFVEK